jgi:hypothetical protein
MCCGKNRQLARNTTNRLQAARPSPTPAASSSTVFQYHGHSKMVVIGPVSGRAYQFGGPGARAEVDPRDRASLSSIPSLRRTS